MLTWSATSLAAMAQPTSTAAPNLAEKTSTLGSASNNPNNPIQDSIWMDSVQKQTIKYFWDFAHPTSGLARERSNIAYNYGSEVVTTGGSGMGFMALIVGVERGWLKREDVVNHLLKTVKFLAKADHYHGIFPHW
ncbi:MAG: beta-glucosidase, partial [Bacteroidota bacterium]